MQNAISDDLVELLQKAADQGRVVLVLPASDQSAPDQPAVSYNSRRAMAAAFCQIFGLQRAAGKALAALVDSDFVATEDLHREISPRGVIKSSSKSLHVALCRLRHQLRPYGIGIATIFGLGFRLEDGSRDKLQKMLAEYNQRFTTPPAPEAA